MTELSRHSAVPEDQLSICENPGPNPFRHSNQDNIAYALNSPGHEFRQQAGRRRVFHSHRQAHFLFNHSLYVEIGPVEIRREYQALGDWIDSPGEADADALNGLVMQGLLHPRHAVRYQQRGCRRIGRQMHLRPRKQSPFQVHRRNRGQFRVDVNGNHHQVVVQLKQGRGASSRRRINGAFANPLLSNQLLNDLRHGASLQSGLARQIGSGDRLVGPDQFQNDVTVYAPRSFARGNLNIRQVNVPHTSCVLVRLHRNPLEGQRAPAEPAPATKLASLTARSIA
jgi:hypothetical protein